MDNGDLPEHLIDPLLRDPTPVERAITGEGLRFGSTVKDADGYLHGDCEMGFDALPELPVTDNSLAIESAHFSNFSNEAHGAGAPVEQEAENDANQFSIGLANDLTFPLSNLMPTVSETTRNGFNHSQLGEIAPVSSISTLAPTLTIANSEGWYRRGPQISNTPTVQATAIAFKKPGLPASTTRRALPHQVGSNRKTEQPPRFRTMSLNSDSATPVDISDTSMIIVKASEMVALRRNLAIAESHSRILRSHNLSLARQNAAMQRNYSRAVAMHSAMVELRALIPVPSGADPSNTAIAEYNGRDGHERHPAIHEDYDLRPMGDVLRENNELAKALDKEKWLAAIMHECCLQWVRDEKSWEAEKVSMQQQAELMADKIARLESRLIDDHRMAKATTPQ